MTSINAAFGRSHGGCVSRSLIEGFERDCDGCPSSIVHRANIGRDGSRRTQSFVGSGYAQLLADIEKATVLELVDHQSGQISWRD